MLLLALTTLALAFPKLTVGSDVLLAPPWGVAYADLFFSADEGWMDRVAAAGLVDVGSRRLPLATSWT